MRTVASFVVMTWWWHEKAPPAMPAGLCVRVVAVVVRLSRWSSLCRHFGDGGAGGGFVDDGFVVGEAATRDCTARLLTARGRPRETWWISARASSENRVSERPASFEVVADVARGLGVGHAGHGVAQRDPLVEGGEGAEADPSAQCRLADEQAGER